MEYRRTAVLELDVPQDADASLRETVEQFYESAIGRCQNGNEQVSAHHVVSNYGDTLHPPGHIAS